MSLFFCVPEFCTENGYNWRNVLELSGIFIDIATLFLLLFIPITFMKYFHSPGFTISDTL